MHEPKERGDNMTYDPIPDAGADPVPRVVWYVGGAVAVVVVIILAWLF
jgi:hypothetical protein